MTMATNAVPWAWTHNATTGQQCLNNSLEFIVKSYEYDDWRNSNDNRAMSEVSYPSTPNFSTAVRKPLVEVRAHRPTETPLVQLTHGRAMQDLSTRAPIHTHAN